MALAGSHLTPLQLTDALSSSLSKTSPGELSSDELDALERSTASILSAIRSLRNMISPIHHLGAEILANIFRQLHQAETPSSHLPFFTTRNSVVAISHVCRRWRETALAVPSIWSLICSGQTLARSSIKRSDGVPLKIYIHDFLSPAVQNTKLLEALVPHSGRIQELHLLDAEDGVVTSDLLCSPAPKLESLTISFQGSYGEPLQVPTGAPLVLFNGITPSLRRLALFRSPCWPGNDFKGLTHLAMCHQVREYRLPMSQFLAFLSASPALEYLSMANAGPLFDGSTNPPVTLNSLRILSIGLWTAPQEVMQFLSCLIIPQKIELYIWGILFQQDDDLPVICPLDTSSSQVGNITHLRITHHPGRHAGRPSSESRYTIISVPSMLQIHGDLEPSQALLAAPRVLDLGSVTELWLGCQFREEPTDQEWRELFLALPLLTTLVISRRTSRPILFALTPQNDEPDIALLCPGLHTLRLYADPSPSILRLSILAEERMMKKRPLRTLEVLSVAPDTSGRRHDYYGPPANGSPYWQGSTPPPYFDPQPISWALPQPTSASFRSDLTYLERYIQHVKYDQVENSEKWELLDAWPPLDFIWFREPGGITGNPY